MFSILALKIKKLKLYKSNNISADESFRYIVIESFPGITVKKWQYLKNIIRSDFFNTLFIHVDDKWSVKKAKSGYNKTCILNCKDEFIDFLRISGVQHLIITTEENLKCKKKGNFSNTLQALTKNAENTWIDSSLSFSSCNNYDGNRFNFLAHELNDFSIPYKMLDKGMVKKAASELGYLYQIRGSVVYGNNLGQKLGYPTANVSPEDNRKKIPARGVYTALVNINDKWYKSMVNIGMRPTFKSSGVTIESHIFDFSDTIYGSKISIHFINKLRDEISFPNIKLLQEQIVKDEKKALIALENIENEFNLKNGFCFI